VPSLCSLLCSLGAVIPFQGVRPIPGSPSHSGESVPFRGVRPIPGSPSHSRESVPFQGLALCRSHQPPVVFEVGPCWREVSSA